LTLKRDLIQNNYKLYTNYAQMLITHTKIMSYTQHIIIIAKQKFKFNKNKIIIHNIKLLKEYYRKNRKK